MVFVAVVFDNSFFCIISYTLFIFIYTLFHSFLLCVTYIPITSETAIS